MGWGHCGTDSSGREIGYCIEATCDHPECDAPIDRGLAYACGGMHGNGGLHGDDFGCEKYFCPGHMSSGSMDQLCESCVKEELAVIGDDYDDDEYDDMIADALFRHG